MTQIINNNTATALLPKNNWICGSIPATLIQWPGFAPLFLTRSQKSVSRTARQMSLTVRFSLSPLLFYSIATCVSAVPIIKLCSVHMIDWLSICSRLLEGLVFLITSRNDLFVWFCSLCMKITTLIYTSTHWLTDCWIHTQYIDLCHFFEKIREFFPTQIQLSVIGIQDQFHWSRSTLFKVTKN